MTFASASGASKSARWPAFGIERMRALPAMPAAKRFA
jgi:hypothetical protein